jgi:dienelactone hydrolase
MTPPLHDERRTLGPTPVRLVWTGDDMRAAAHRGVLIFGHGFSVDIGVQTQELAAIAGAGYLAVGLDAVGHGARRWPDFDARFAGDEVRRARAMFEVVRETAAEVPAVLDALLAEGRGRPERLGIGGISMGGYAAYRACVVDDRLSVLLPILAAPRWPLPDHDSPHHHLERFTSLRLLSQTAGDDEVVDVGSAAAFVEQLRTATGSDGQHRHIEHAGERHHMSEAGWHRLWGNVMAFLDEVWPV